jgi:hypothetical protein
MPGFTTMRICATRSKRRHHSLRPVGAT